MQIWYHHLERWAFMSDFIPDGWRSVKLGDVAEERSDRVDNPCKSGYDRFVGLDHLDSGELTVRRWGSTADLLSTMKLFKSGDILIGRRNAYLKRASKAEFDGVCSGDAYVVREKSGTIVEGFLPIILNSNSFWDYTIAHASGTMSKRAKWRDLAEYTFLLPSMEEQRRIATTLWAAEDCIVKGERFVTAAERAKQVLMRELFSNGIGHSEFNNVKGFGRIPKKWEIKVLKDVAEKIMVGIASAATYAYRNSGIPIFRNQNIKPGYLDDRDLLFLDPIYEAAFKNKRLKLGDLLTARTGYTGTSCIVPPKYHNTQSFTTLITRPNKKIIDNTFLCYYMASDFGKAFFEQNQIGGAQKNVNAGTFQWMPVLIPPLPEQREIAVILTRCDETIAAARANTGAAKALKMKMINEMLGAGKK